MQIRHFVSRTGRAGWRVLYPLFLVLAVCGIAAQRLSAAANEFTFSSATYSVNEGAPGFINVPVVFGGGAAGAVQVTAATVAGGTAVAGVDYTSQTNVLNFAGGPVETNFFTILIGDNALMDGNRTVQLQLSAPSGGTSLGAPSGALLTIVDDETPMAPPPPNDNFTNAIPILGQNGTIAGTTVNATKESGEPNHAGLATPTNTVWYRWTAPGNGTVTFQNSAATPTARLAAYIGTAVNSLTPVASATGFNPAISFIAVAGQEYQIAVARGPGAFALTWSTAGFAGNFRWTSDLYFGSILEGNSPADPNTSLKTFDGTVTSADGIRVTVTRDAGFVGRMYVTCQVNDGTATNGLHYTVLGQGNTLVSAPTNIAPGQSQITLEFRDFQTSASFFILPSASQQFLVFADINLSLQIVGVTPHVNESPLILPPTFDPTPSTVNITEALSGGYVERTHFRVDEDIGTATVRFVRGLGSADGSRVDFEINRRPLTAYENAIASDAGAEYADPRNDTDLENISGSWTWGVGQTFQDIDVDITDDGIVEFNEVFRIDFFPPPATQGPAAISNTRQAFITILTEDRVTAEHPAGSVDPAWNRDYLNTTTPPNNSAPGANGQVQALVMDPDGKTVIGGDFVSVNSAQRLRLARMNADGSVDTTFLPGNSVDNGANSSVLAVIRQTNGSYVIGGAFSSYKGTLRQRVARVTSTGVLDGSFNPGNGANAAVRALGIYTNAGPNQGKIIVAGDFITFNGQQAGRIARLQPNGAYDPTFATSIGANGPVRAVLVLASGKVVIGGDFTTVNGVARNRIARLNVDGSLDESFDPGAGMDNSVYALSIDQSGTSFQVSAAAQGGPEEDRQLIDTGATSGTVVLNYDFLFVPDTIRVYYEGNLLFDSGLTNGVATVNIPYGPGTSTSVEIVVNEGGSPDLGTVWFYDAEIFPTGGVQRYMAGGAFSMYDNRSRSRIVRIDPNGALDGTHQPGFGFDDTVFTLAQGPANTAYAGGVFTGFNGTRRVGIARLLQDGTLDTRFMDTAYNHYAGIPTTNSIYSEPKNFVTALAVAPDGGVHIGGKFKHVGGGGRNTVAGGVNSPWGPNIPTPFYINREDLRNRSNVARLIGGNTAGPGQIGFTDAEYFVDEAAGNLFITLTRINGTLGAAGVVFRTGDRPTGPGAATSGVDYVSASTPLIWDAPWNAPGNLFVTVAQSGPNNTTSLNLDNITLTVPDDNLNEGNETFNLSVDLPTSFVSVQNSVGIFTEPRDGKAAIYTLFNGGSLNGLGGETIPIGVALTVNRTATVTILDDDPEPAFVSFSVTDYTVDENAGIATITVQRSGGLQGTVSMDYFANDGTAVNGSDYFLTSGQLVFGPGETEQTFDITLINDSMSEPDQTILLTLANVSGATFLPGGNAATLTIYDDDFANGTLRFSQANYPAVENGGMVAVTVQRTGGNVGAIRADFSTSNGSGVAGVDYVTTTSQLTWANGDSSPRVLMVPLLTDGVVDGTKVFNVSLANAVVMNTLAPVPVFTSPAAVTVADADAFGSLQFASANFAVAENGGAAIITVTRSAGVSETVMVNFTTADGTATAGTHYGSTNGTLTLGPGVTSASFTVPILDDAPAAQNANTTVLLSLNTFVNGVPGAPANAVLTIVDNETVNEPAGSLDTAYNAGAGPNGFINDLQLQPDGRLLVAGEFTSFNDSSRRRIARVDVNGQLDPVFDVPGGANDSVFSIALQGDGRVVAAGAFTNLAGANRNRIHRLNADGSSDSSFDPGPGADGTVFSVALHPDVPNINRVVIGGAFATVGGESRPFVARLNTNGTLDATFSTGTGPDAQVFSVAVEPDGQVLIGGDFTSVNGIASPGLARLNADGSVDTAFAMNLGAGFAGSVRSVVLQSDGRILVGGSFTNFQGAAVGRIVRLLASGLPDATFAPNAGPAFGADGTVLRIAIQPDDKLVVVGDFMQFAGVGRSRVTRLTPDGASDATINFGTGANNFIADAVVQLNDGKIVLGGGFTEFDGQPRNFLARVHGGVIAGAGRIEFESAQFVVNEIETNVVVRVRRLGGTTGAVSADFATSPGTATGGAAPGMGVDFLNSVGTVTFAEGQTLAVINLPLFDDTAVEGNETLSLALSNPQGGAVIGNQPLTEVLIVDDDSLVNFGSAAYAVNEGVVSGVIGVDVVRSGGINGTFSVAVVTSNLTATAGADYVAVTNVLNFLPGELSKIVNISILNDAVDEGDEQFAVLLQNATGAATIGAPATVAVTIIEDDFFPGQFRFSQAAYSVDENGSNLLVTVIRTNGSSGTATVNFSTANGTALAAQDYSATNGVLSFAQGETSKSFLVAILPDMVQEPDETFTILLSGPTGGATLTGVNPVPVTILNNNESIFGNFRMTTAATNVTEGDGALLLTVIRTGGTMGDVTVDIATAGGTATSGSDFTATNATLQFLAGVTSQVFSVGILTDDLVESNETFTVNLSNATGGASVATPASTLVTIISTNARPGDFAFETTTFTTVENAGTATITVLRTNGVTGAVSVGVRVSDGTATSPADYTVPAAVGGVVTLNWADGDAAPKTFTVMLVDDALVEPTETVLFSMEAPVGGVISQGAATLSIFDNEVPAGSLDSGFVASSGADGIVYGLGYLPSNGQIAFGGDFTTAGGLPRMNVARLTSAGAVDGFDPGVFARNDAMAPTVRAVFTYTNGPLAGRVLVAGRFDSVNGSGRTNLVRFNADGTVDDSFNTGAGPNGLVHALAVAPDNSVYIGGEFTQVAGAPRSFLAKLTPSGALDGAFNPPSAPSGFVRALALQADAKVVAGGDFANVGATLTAGLARFDGASGALDAAYMAALGTGAADRVFALAVQTDGALLVGGAFTGFNGIPAPRLLRLLPGGTVDPAFNGLGSGFNNTVAALRVGQGGRIYVGGAFTRLNGLDSVRFVALTPSGARDLTFNPGSGANDLVTSIIEQVDGDVVIGGAFTQFNNQTAERIARINGGSNIGTGVIEFSPLNYSVNEAGFSALIRVERIGGLSNAVSAAFTTADGTATAGADYIATNGTLSFLEGEAVKTFNILVSDDAVVEGDETVQLLLTSVMGAVSGTATNGLLTIVDNDSTIGFSSPTFSVGEQVPVATITVVRTGGTAATVTLDFSTAAGTATAGADYEDNSGTLTFNPGESVKTFDVTVLQDMMIEGNETVLLSLANVTGPSSLVVSAAMLTIVDDEAGPGAFGFSAPTYTVVEGEPMLQVAVLRTNGSLGAVSVQVATSDGTALAGPDYTAVTTTLAFADGETMKLVDIPIAEDNLIEGDETFNLTLSNPVGGAVLGDPVLAVATIQDNDSLIEFSMAGYSVVEDTGFLIVDVVRGGGTNGVASVDYATADDTALAGQDYLMDAGTLVFPPGVTNLSITLTVIADVLVEAAENFTIALSNPTNAVIGMTSPATVTIVDDDSVIELSAPALLVSEAAGVATVSLVRSGNLNGSAVATVGVSGITAISGLDFVGLTNVINFNPGDANMTFDVTILDDTLVEGNETVAIQILSVVGSSTAGAVSNAVLTIEDDDFAGAISLASASFSVVESAGVAVIDLVRTGGSAQQVSVNLSVANGTATAGADYVATNAVVVFPDGATNATVLIEILNDSLVEGDETVFLNVNNPTGGATVGTIPNGTLTIVDDDFNGMLQFSSPTFTFTENGGSALVTVDRVGGVAGAVSVGFNVVGGTATLGTDFSSPAGSVLMWGDGDGAQRTITIPLINDNTGEADETIIVTLVNPTGGATLGSPAGTTVTIVDDDSSAAFSATSYTVNETNATATITVNRLGTTTGTLQVSYAATAGTAAAGADFTAASGAVSWGVGDGAPKTFTVPILDDGLLEGSETVSLALSNPVGGTLGTPSTAILTIIDNDISQSLVPAGVTLLSESGPVNGIIDPNETVTVSLGVRNVGGGATVNLVGTLLTTNGVSAPSGPQNFGALVPNGPAAARSYTFTANTTNGAVVTAALQMQDGASNLGLVPYMFNIGTRTTKFVNTNAITINAVGPATPYPSAISVAGLSGTVGKITITLSNLTHAFPADIDIALVGPNGVAVKLMSDVGSSASTPNPVNAVNLTFDDAAATALTTSQIVSGTFRPSDINVNEPAEFFEAPGPGSGPFAAALSAFNGISPNGDWRLFVLDDNAQDAGSIARGWCITFVESAQVNPAGNIAVSGAVMPVPALAGDVVGFNLSVTNTGANPASMVELTNTLPAGMTYMAVTNPHGSVFQSGGTAIFQLGSITPGGVKTVAFTALASGSGLRVNTAAARSSLTEANLADNAVALPFTVIASADLSLLLTDAPDAVVLSNLVTYTMTVSNAGPSTATGVLLTNTLPAGMQFVSGSNAFGSVTPSGSTVVFALGNRPAGSVAVVSLNARATAVGQVTDAAAVGSTAQDLAPGNNSASTKTVVIAQPALVQMIAGSQLTLTWPSDANNFVLECTTDLNPPAVWTPVTAMPVDAGGVFTVVLTIDPMAPTKFFRLRQVP